MFEPRIEVRDCGSGGISVDCPYHPQMIRHARLLGGRFIHGRDLWFFEATEESRVRAMLRLLYGWDGPPQPAPRWVTIRYRFDGTEGGEFWIAGHHVAERRVAGTMPVLGPGVSIIAGGFESRGGTRTRPALGGAGTVVAIQGVAEPLALVLATDNPRQIQIVGTPDSEAAVLPAEVLPLPMLLRQAQRYLAALDRGAADLNAWPLLVVDELGGDVVLRDLIRQSHAALAARKEEDDGE